MSKFISRLMLASATIALGAALTPIAANAFAVSGGNCPGASGCPTDGLPWTVTGGAYQLTAPNTFSPSSLVVNGAGSVTVNPGATLNDDAIIGDSSSGTFTNNSTHNVSGNLILGNQASGSGLYTIAGAGAVTNVTFADPKPAGQPNGALIVGNAGSGIFNQGTNAATDPNNQVNVAGDLALGHQTGSQGTYNLNAGALTIGGQLSVGGQSTLDNVFNQVSGSVILTGLAAHGGPGGHPNPLYESVPFGSPAYSAKLTVGGGLNDNGGNAGGTGTYNLYGGTIDATANGIEVGATGHGIMNQSGGSVTTTYMSEGDSGIGTYNLSGGTINAFREAVGNAGTGAFNQSGGAHTVGLNPDGSLQDPGNAALTIGAHCCDNTLGSGTYDMTGGELHTGNMVVGDGEQGSFLQHEPVVLDPLVEVTGNLIVGGAAGGNGAYSITGDDSTLNVLFAPGGNGTGNTNGGPGTANANGALIVGEFGTGTFTQGNGSDNPTVSVAGDLSIGHQGSAGNPDSVTDSVGTYTINSGTLTVGGSIEVGAASLGNNVFTQNDGTVTVTGSAGDVDVFNNKLHPDYVGVGTSNHTGELFLGGGAGPDNDGGSGTYNMHGGTLNVGLIEDGHAGTGVFNQDGGTVNASLWMGNAPGSNGTYNLDGGTLNAGYGTGGFEAVGLDGGQTSTFNQTGGVNQTDKLEIGVNYGTTGIYNLDSFGPTASQLIVTNDLTIGETGHGVFNQTNGSVTAGSLTMGTVGTTPNGSGIYNLLGGTLAVSGNETVGTVGYGEFNQGSTGPGGIGPAPTNTVTGSLYLGAFDNINPNGGFQPREGVYNLNKGTLSTTNTYVGELGQGIFTQSAGTTHTIANDLVIGHLSIPFDPAACDGACVSGGPSNGLYNMNGGTLDTGNAVVGDQGIGTLNISGNSQFHTIFTPPTEDAGGFGGDMTIARSLGSAGSSVTIGATGENSPSVTVDGYLTVGAGDVGSLTLNSGTLTVGAQAIVGGGPDGVGHVTQTGGNFETGALLIGVFTGNGSPANSYAMTGGNLIVDNAFVIGSGSQNGAFSEGSGGTFTQSGTSSVTVGAAYINNGTYNLHGGTFQSNDFLKVGDTKTGALFNQTGGTATIATDLLIGGTYFPGPLSPPASPGTIAGTYNLSGGTLTVGGDIILGQNTHGDGTFTYTGGTLGFSPNEGGHQIVVGDAGKGTFNLGSVGHAVDMNLGTLGATLVIGQQAGSNGTFNIAAGSSLEDSLIVGDAGAGSFNNAGGTHSVTGDLILGNQATGVGTYNLTAGGTTTVTGSTTVGNSGTGTFTNNASTHNTHILELASAANSNGTYNLENGGTLNVGTSGDPGFADIGQHGTLGKFVQNGATSSTTVYGSLDVGRFFGGTGQVDLNAGSMTVNGFATVGDSGTGTFNQGGASTMSVVGSGLSIGRGESNENGDTVITGTGTYNLSGTAGLTVTGGIEMGQSAGNTGTMNQTGGTVIADNETIGDGGIGHWIQSGGSNSISGAVIVNNSGTLNGSSLSVSSGSLSAATVTNNDQFTMTGGTVTSAVTNNHQFTFQGGAVVGSVTNNATLYSNGGGTATITGPLSNTATGTTHVSNSSTLKVDGEVTNASTVTVDAGSKLDASGHGYTQNSGTTTVDGQVAANLATIILGTLQGNGTVDGNLVNVGGKVRGGDNGAPGDLAVTGTYDQQMTAAFETTIAGITSNQVGRLNVGGIATLSGALNVITDSFTFAAGELFNIMNFAGSLGDFTSFSLNGSACSSIGVDSYSCAGLASGLYFQEQFANSDTALNLFIAQMEVTPPTDVPEPMTIGLFVAGIGGVTVIRRRRKSSHKAA